MILVGLDDTDTLDTPGTNQLARHLARQLRDEAPVRWIVRYQLLVDARVPCTRKNGCVAMAFAEQSGLTVRDLAKELPPLIRDWCPAGSDPGLCIAEAVPGAVVDFGKRCQRQFIRQAEARQLASQQGIYLEGLGGTEDGVIGALAAVGLASAREEGRIVYLGSAQPDIHDISGRHSVAALHALGIEQVRRLSDGSPVLAGQVEIEKRLRPNFCRGSVVLFVSPAERSDASEEPLWLAERVV